MRRPPALWLDAAIALSIAVCLVPFGGRLVVGGSMRPALEPGDVVLYRRGARDVERGSIVVLGEARGGYVHRVADVTAEGMLITRGDANPIPDRSPVPSAKVRGRVVASLHSGALLRRLASSMGRARLWSQSHTQR